jgi:hypothetical protein
MPPPILTVRTAPPAMSFTCGILPAIAESASASARVGMGILRLPFDAARAEYARGVQVGLIERSMLASRDFECALGALERLTLGPLARHV